MSKCSSPFCYTNGQSLRNINTCSCLTALTYQRISDSNSFRGNIYNTCIACQQL